MPGFAVGFVDSTAMVAQGAECETGSHLSNGKDEPRVVGNNMGDHEVDFGGLVGDNCATAVPEGVDVVEAVDQTGGAFDLDASKSIAFGPVAANEDEVETFAVAVGLGDAEAFFGGFVGEG